MLKKLTKEQKGFTLIELMIVIAIIGILAAIAIPNFIAYRDKSFCSAVEADANTIAAAVADYFAIPSNTTLAGIASLNNGNGVNISSGNTGTVSATNPNAGITINVTDGSARCPSDYTDAATRAVNSNSYWATGAGNTNSVFTKLIR